MDDAMKASQEAAAQVEEGMMTFLLQFDPARELKVCDVKMIAQQARVIAWNNFADLCAVRQSK